MPNDTPQEHSDGSSKGTFRVINRKTGLDISGAFVLLPEVDSAARTALAAYSEATPNPNIARFIRDWLKSIHDRRTLGRQVIEKLREDGALMAPGALEDLVDANK